MNVSEKNALERMIEKRAELAYTERTTPAKPTPTVALVKLVQKAYDTAAGLGWNITQPPYGSTSGEITLTPNSNNPASKRNQKADAVTVKAITAAKDAAIIELWTSDEFDLAAVFATLDAAKRT